MSQKELGRVKKVTLAEIARIAEVSKATVSLVINGKQNSMPISMSTRQRVLDAATLLGYRPNAAARTLATGRSKTALMVAFDLWDENLTERLRGVESYLVPLGYSTRMCTVEAGQGAVSYEEILRSGQADGVLLCGLASPNTYPILHHIRQVADAMGVPIVALANAFPREYVDRVAHIDDESGAEEAVSHLVGHGHRRIVLLGVADQEWARSREKGYYSALEHAGILIDPSLIALGDRSQSWAYRTTLELTESVDFSAMFVMTDNMAIAALSALRSAGRQVPRDCAVIGFDNGEKVAKYSAPPLTTVNNPFYETGQTAAEVLVCVIEGGKPKDSIIPVTLVIRESCGCSC